ncbi:MAG: oligosaccharide flippase family protein [Planctomycetota bacterium]|nr:oligosaccharide flippase family protein [Planctomycetota bacterium]
MPNDNSQLSRKQAALLLIAGRVVGSLLTIMTAALLSRWWSGAEYGEYRKVWLAFQALSPFATLGVPAGLAFFLPQIDRGRQKSAVGQAAVLLLCSGGLISVATIGWSVFGGSEDSTGRLSAAAAFALYPVFALPLLVTDGWLVAIGKSRSAAFFTMQTAFLQSIAVILPAACGCGVATVMGWLTLTTVVRFLIAVSIYRSEYGDVAARWDPGFLGRLLAYTVPLGLAGIVGSVHLMLDKLVMACWLDAESFAIYANGATELPAIGIVSSSVAAVLAPEFVRLFQAGRLREMLELWRSSVRTTGMLVFPLTAGMLLYAPDAVAFLYSEKYLDSVPVFRIYLLLLPLRVTVHGSLLLAAGQSRAVFAASALGLVLAAMLLGTLVPVCGMTGAAAALVLAVYAVAGFLLVRTARLVGVSWWQSFPWRHLGLTLAASVAGAATAASVTQPMGLGNLRLLTGLGITAATFVAINAGPRRSRDELLAVVNVITGQRSSRTATG